MWLIWVPFQKNYVIGLKINAPCCMDTAFLLFFKALKFDLFVHDSCSRPSNSLSVPNMDEYFKQDWTLIRYLLTSTSTLLKHRKCSLLCKWNPHHQSWGCCCLRLWLQRLTQSLLGVLLLTAAEEPAASSILHKGWERRQLQSKRYMRRN